MINAESLIDYLNGERYLLSDNNGSEKYENEHQYELGNNRMIEKTIEWVKDCQNMNKELLKSLTSVHKSIYNQESKDIANAINTLKNLDNNKEKYEKLLNE